MKKLPIFVDQIAGCGFFVIAIITLIFICRGVTPNQDTPIITYTNAWKTEDNSITAYLMIEDWVKKV